MPVISATEKNAISIPLHAREGITPPRTLKKIAAKIGCKAVSAVPVATLVYRIARKKHMKCIARKKPARADQAMARC